MEKEKKVITVQIDEEFYDSLVANGGNGGESATVDDIMWYLDIYKDSPLFNFTKGTYTTSLDLEKEKPIDDNAKSILAGMFSNGIFHSSGITNLNAPQSGKDENVLFMLSRIKVSGTVKSEEDEGFSKTVETFIAMMIWPSFNQTVLWLKEEKQSFEDLYAYPYYLTDMKIIAPNGLEIELPNNE